MVATVVYKTPCEFRVMVVRFRDCIGSILPSARKAGPLGPNLIRIKDGGSLLVFVDDEIHADFMLCDDPVVNTDTSEEIPSIPGVDDICGSC